MTDYVPIDCSFHDMLEALVVRGTVCEVVCRDATGGRRSATARFLDVFAEGREEFVRSTAARRFASTGCSA